MKPCSVLLTGSTGFLGSYILKRLVDEGYKVIVLKRSFSNTFRIKEYLDRVISYDINLVPLEKVFNENKIDVVIHCATDYGRKNAEPLQVIDANLILPLKILELCKSKSIQCFINTDTILDKRINYYSLSKEHFNDWLRYYKNTVRCINVMIEHFYGPGDDNTKFVTYIVQNLVMDVDKIDLTKGEQERDFVYIEDVVNAFIKILENSFNQRIDYYEYQIGSNKPLKIKSFVSLAKEISGNKHTILNFGALPYRENEIMKCVADISEMKKLGWSPKIPLEIGLKRTIDYELRSIS